MAVTQLVRKTQIKPGTANRVAVNDANGKLVDLAELTASMALASDANGLPVASSTTVAELGYVAGVSSAIQDQITSKLSKALTSAHIFVGSSGDVATDRELTGDVTIDNTGVTSIGSLVIEDADINGSAAIARSKIAAGTGNRLVVNDGSTGLLTDLAALDASMALASDANGLPVASSTSAAELGYVAGVSSAIQTQFTGKAGTTLANLDAVAINTSLTSDTTKTDDLGTDAIEWKDAWLHAIKHDSAVSGEEALTISTTGNNGNIVLFPNGTGTVDVSGTKITSVYAPAADTDAANKLYVDNLVQGLNIHAPCLVATITPLAAVTASGTKATHILTYDAVGVQLVDGHSLVLNNRILVKNQVTTTDNGIYDVTTEPTAGVAGVLTRAVDFNGAPVGEVATGDFTLVQHGDTISGTGWVVTSGTGTIDVDVAPITWTQFSSGSSYTEGNGIDITGTVISLAPLTATNILVGNGSNVATGVAMSSQATMDNAGAVTLSNAAVIAKTLTSYSASAGTVSDADSIIGAIQKIDGNDALKLPLAGGTLTGALTIDPATNQLVLGGVSSGKKVTISSTAPAADRILTIPVATGDRNFLLSGEAAIVTGDISASAGITLAQLASIGVAKIIVGNGSGVAAAVDMSGDATIDNAGVITLSATALGSAHFVTRSLPATGAIDGSNRVFTTAVAPIAGTEHVFLNGVLQNAGSGKDYQISTDTITFEVGNAPPSGSVLLISYHK